MNINILEHFLLWSAFINYGILILWFLLFKFGRRWFYPLSNWFCPLSGDEFNRLNYLGIMFYKLFNIMFFLVPYLALRIAA
jgi:hypothetical protein